MKPLIIDTSIWVNWLRGSHAHLRDQARGRMLMMPSPIVLELTAGARSKSSVRVTNQLLQPFIQNRRVIVPSHEDYLLAGETLSELEWPSSRAALDALITVCAKKIGAEIWTLNLKDFNPLCQKFSVTCAEL